MKIIGITGQSGSGKSSLCVYLEKHGIPCINADEVYHSLLSPDSECTAAIVRGFGEGILASDGSPDRKKLASIVFSDADKLDKLNRITLGFAIDRIKQMLDRLREKGHRFAAVDAPTLIESGFYRECDFVVSVLASPESRICRIMSRDGISEEKARERTAAQKDDSFYTDKSDFIIRNDSDVDTFIADAQKLLENIGVK